MPYPSMLELILARWIRRRRSCPPVVVDLSLHTPITLPVVVGGAE
ncbi:hypothetical protein [Salana multivorans]